MDNEDLVTVYTVSNSVEGEIIKNALQAQGIRCFLSGENQAAEAGLIGLAIQVQVPLASADKARKLIAAHEGHKAKPHGWTEKKK
jgi:hypothetical protein